MSAPAGKLITLEPASTNSLIAAVTLSLEDSRFVQSYRSYLCQKADSKEEDTVDRLVWEAMGTEIMSNFNSLSRGQSSSNGCEQMGGMEQGTSMLSRGTWESAKNGRKRPATVERRGIFSSRGTKIT